VKSSREGAVGALGLVEHRDVRLDPTIVDQPVEHRPIGGVADQPGGIEIEALHRAVDHALGCQDLGLTNGSPS
jgi:hypothetical protein